MTTFNKNGDVSIDYNNVVKNIKNYKYPIAQSLGIKDENTLNKFLAHYINSFSEVEHVGEAEMYTDITLKELMDDIKSTYQYTNSDEWNVVFDSDKVKAQDLK